ncbi:hypothetical protein PZA11_001978 [Diplocarpon coronariae]
MVDCWTALHTTLDTVDGVRPNEARMVVTANAWVAPLSGAVAGVGGGQNRRASSVPQGGHKLFEWKASYDEYLGYYDLLIERFCDEQLRCEYQE